ncbi:hypothetical protein KR093_008477 [Drosophila rubida]|uniref:Protein Mabiki n=1 Tax=Drosophila rubida TaxID=30044 RepID=A0AAD4K8G9_9MUSC|nr:hypothetical protein KR093_008477 [Drosophila rubida]
MEHQSNQQATYLPENFTSQKRKRDADMILAQNKENVTEEAPVSKRRQLTGFFRPWLDNEQNIEATSTQKHSSTPSPAVGSTYHANMVRQKSRQRSPREQQRRDRNTLACLLSRRARQAQDAQLALQYEQYRAQQAVIMEQQVRFGLYYRQLLQQAIFQPAVNLSGIELPPQQQEFLQQMSLSQQLMIFGTHR